MVMEKFCDYLLGSPFQVYTDNNPPAYDLECKLGASQIQWLGELVLLDFVINYQTGHSNRATDTPSHCSFNPSCKDSFSKSKANSDEVEVISYSSACEAIDLCLNSTKFPEDFKQEAQNISSAIGPIMGEVDKDEIVSNLNDLSIFEQVTHEKMTEEQQKDPAGEKPKTSAIAKIKSKTVQTYLLQSNRLTMKKGVLHWLYINNDKTYHQMVLQLKYQAQVLQLLHDGQGHQGIETTSALCQEQFYWNTMFQDATRPIKNCPQWQIVKRDYTEQSTIPGVLIAHNPMDLVCIDFTKVDPLKDGKETSWF